MFKKLILILYIFLMQSPINGMEHKVNEVNENPSQMSRFERTKSEMAKRIYDEIEPKIKKTHILFLCTGILAALRWQKGGQDA